MACIKMSKSFFSPLIWLSTWGWSTIYKALTWELALLFPVYLGKDELVLISSLQRVNVLEKWRALWSRVIYWWAGSKLPLMYISDLIVLVSPGILSREIFSNTMWGRTLTKSSVFIAFTLQLAQDPTAIFIVWVTQTLTDFVQEQFV